MVGLQVQGGIVSIGDGVCRQQLPVGGQPLRLIVDQKDGRSLGLFAYGFCPGAGGVNNDSKYYFREFRLSADIVFFAHSPMNFISSE